MERTRSTTLRTPLRATIAVTIAVCVLLTAAIAGARTLPPGGEASEDAGRTHVPTTGTDADPGGSVDGWDGQGSPPDRGTPDLPGVTEPTPCGVEVVLGDGPDAAVAIAPCPGEGPVPTGPKVVEPRPGMADVRPHPFDTATVGDDGRTVTIDYWSGIEPCAVLDHVDVVETPDAVTITLFSGSDPAAGDVACIEIAVQHRVVISLDDPLGERPIVDGALDTVTPGS
jgi:hypothetical protein